MSKSTSETEFVEELVKSSQLFTALCDAERETHQVPWGRTQDRTDKLASAKRIALERLESALDMFLEIDSSAAALKASVDKQKQLNAARAQKA